VGVTTFRVDDTASGRQFDVEAWYPADSPEEAEVAVYAAQIAGVAAIEISSPRGAVRDAPTEPSALPAPVVLFSHGGSGLRTMSFFLGEHLASHGYLVLAPDHPGNILTDTTMTDQQTAMALPLLIPGDLSATLDDVIRRSAGDSVLAGVADGTRVGVAGHSYGAYAALAVAGAQINRARVLCGEQPEAAHCALLAGLELGAWESVHDERILAAAPMAPAGIDYFGAEGVSHVAVPVLVQGAADDFTVPFYESAQVVYNGLRSPRFLLRLRYAGHLAFTNVCEVVETVGTEAMRKVFGEVIDDGCGPDFLRIADGHAVIAAVTTAFFDRYLRGDASAEKYLRPRYVEGLQTANLDADP
jgi:predicted dienelactone hydrolase